MHVDSAQALGHLAAAGGLGYLIGFERHLRGRAAGERTFALLALGAAAFTMSGEAFPGDTGKIIAGVATGVGFIGAGLVWHDSEPGQVHGLTTAAAGWASVAIGVLAGAGLLALASALSAIMLLILEVPYVPGLRLLDGARYHGRFRWDPSRPGDQPAMPPDPDEA